MAAWLLALAFILAALAGGPHAALADDMAACRAGYSSVKIAACSRVIAKSATPLKERTEALALRASAYLGKSEMGRAAADAEEALKLDTTASGTSMYKGLLALSRRERKDAIEHFTESVRLDTQNSRAYTFRALTYRATNDLLRSLADFDSALKLDPSFVHARYNRGWVHYYRGDVDLALTDFEDTLKAVPDHAGAHNGAGSVHRRKGNRERAKQAYDLAIKYDSGLTVAFQNRGGYYLDLSQFDAAIAEYDIAISLDPSLAGAVNSRGYAYWKKGEVTKAMTDYSAALKLAPDHIAALNNRSLAYQKLGDKQLALADAEKAITIKATDTGDLQRQEAARERALRLRKEVGPAAPVARPEPARPKRVALVIGNSKYQNVGPLQNPGNDASAVASSLRRLGFTALTKINDATRDQLSKGLKDFGDLADGAEWAVVYFAGHGIEVNGTSYLIPVDAVLKRDTHAEDEAISLSRVMAKLDNVQKLGLVLLDACRNNPFASRMIRSAGATRSLGNGLGLVEPEGNVLVFYSAKHGTAAADGSDRHSPFTEALLTHIEQPGLEVNFLFRKIRDDVRRKTDRKQEPFIYGSLGSDPLYFKLATAR